MTRSLKAVGLALVAILAMTAVLASAASASNGRLISNSGNPVILHGEQPAASPHKFVLTDNGNLSTTCTGATFEGTTASSNSTPVVHPVYTGCTAFGLNSTITTTGCDYEFHITTTIGATNTFDGDVDVECGTGAIKITTLTCELLVDTQQGLTTVEAANAGASGTNMDINVTAKVTGIDYTVTKDGIGCPLSKVGTFTEGDYEGTVTLKGFKDNSGTKGEQEGITIVDP